MTKTIRVRAALRMRCPAHLVREQYRDIDHHIRNNVHPGIRYEWVPAPAGVRKIRTRFRILGIPQYDVSQLEDAPDGSFIIRYLEGSNAGTVLVHRFLKVSETETEVQLSADIPATLFRRLLGPAFIWGSQAVMKKALLEDKQDLERNGFRIGQAHGNLEAAFSSARRVAQERVEVRRLLMDVGCAVAALDAAPTLAQRDALNRLAGQLELEPSTWTGRQLDELAHQFRSSKRNVERELNSLGAAIAKHQLTDVALSVAATVGLVSNGLSVEEFAGLRRIAQAARVAEDVLRASVERADSALGRGAA